MIRYTPGDLKKRWERGVKAQPARKGRADNTMFFSVAGPLCCCSISAEAEASSYELN